MGKKTLYVGREDEEVWNQARQALGVGDESLSKLVTQLLGQHISRENANGKDIGRLRVTRKEHDALVARLRQVIFKNGWEKAALAFARALMLEGALRHQAAVDANVTKRNRRQARRGKAETANTSALRPNEELIPR